MMTGVPGISFSNTNGTSDPPENWTGSSEGARMFVAGNYRLSSIGQSPRVQRSGRRGALRAGYHGLRPPLPTGLQEGAGGLRHHAVQYVPNGSAGTQLINEAAFTIRSRAAPRRRRTPSTAWARAWSASATPEPAILINVPGTRVLNFDMTFSKNFPLKSEKRVLIFRAEMYNIFNHPQFQRLRTSAPSYDWNNWKNGVLVQTSNTLGRYTATLNPRQMSMSLRFQF